MAVAHDANHAAGRALAAVTYVSVPRADGFLFLSRYTGDACVAVFGRAFGRLSLLSVMPLVANAEFLQVLAAANAHVRVPLRASAPDSGGDRAASANS